MIKAVLFDLDDTLAAEEHFVKSGYHAVAEYLANAGRDTQSAGMLYEKLYALYQESAVNVFNRLFDLNGWTYTKEDILELVQLYRAHEPKTCFYEDVLPVVLELKRRGIKLGIISDGYALTQRNKIKALGANALFDKIILTDELGREYWKPSPRAFLLMQEAFSVNYSEMMYVGDNPQKDFYIGKNLPILTVRIKREAGVYIDSAYLDGVKEKLTISSLTELLLIAGEEKWENS